jgi:lysophospholipase L1-like esterase
VVLDYHFVFDENSDQRKSIKVLTNQPYNQSLGYGYVISKPSKDELKKDSCPGDYFDKKVPTFAIDLPNGNYEVSMIGSDTGIKTTVKSGIGCLHVKSQIIDMKETFCVHIDNGQLKMAFSPFHTVKEMKISSKQAPTIFLAGDSTVTNQPSGQYPSAGWGQVLPYFFNNEIAISNHACSGRSSKSFIFEQRLETILKHIGEGDFLLIQFGHNDSKEDERGTDPFSSFQEYLKQYIDGARAKGASPVLISPMHRRIFNSEESIVDSHGDYITAIKQLGIEENVSFIDLAAKSKVLFEKVGKEETKNLFMYAKPGEYEAFPDGINDDTHFQEAGAIEIARLVTDAIKEQQLPLRLFLKN